MLSKRRIVESLCALISLLVLFYSFWAGRHLDATNVDAKLGAAPFVGRWHWRVSARTFLSLGVVACALAVIPSLQRLRTRTVVLGSAFCSAVFGWSLAVLDGWSAVVRPVLDKTEYWSDVQRAKPAGTYLRTYVARGLYHSVHVRGHPPGMALLLIAMRANHFRSAWAAAGLFVISMAVVVVAVSGAVWRLGGIDVARMLAPALALAPFAVWQVSSADSFFAAVGCVSVAFGAFAATTHGFRSVICALMSGVCAGFLMLLTYGAPTLLVPMCAAVVFSTRRFRWLAPFAIGIAMVAGVFARFGFWWPTGFRAVRVFYWSGTAKFRPWQYFLVANLGVLLLAVGLPVGVAFCRGVERLCRGECLYSLPLASAAGVVIADISQMSKGETERIWLLFMPWLLVAAYSIVRSSRSLRYWVAAQGIAAIVMQSALVSKW